MLDFITILLDIILPIFVIMAVGYTVQKKFQMNLATLAKINMYYVVPAFSFAKLYSTEISVSLLGSVLLFFSILMSLLYLLTSLTAKFLNISGGKKRTFTNSVMLYNSGNYGVPVNQLVFQNDPFAMSIQVIVMTLQNILTYSYGIFTLQSAKLGKLNAIVDYFKMPVFIAMVLGILFNFLNVKLPEFLLVPITYISDAMVGVALFTLGAQVAEIDFKRGLAKVFWSLLLRLLVSPLLSFGIILFLKLEGVLAQALLISSCMPTAVNSAIIAEEYNNYPGFAAQIVLFSTLFSSVTVTFVIYIAKLIF